jgi:hypothetical protein
MAKKPKTPKATAQEKSLAKNAANNWNDYVERYIPVEDEFAKRTQATDDKVAQQRGIVNADANMAYSKAADAAQKGMAAQGAAPGSGRAALGQASLADARGSASGLGQAFAQQGVHDREQNARVKMSAFGRGMADQSQISLGDQARRATGEALNAFGRKIDNQNNMMKLGLGAAGMGVQYGMGQGMFNHSGVSGVRRGSQQDMMLADQTRGF